MKVIGVGLQKTGTTTLGWCFDKMGFRHRSYDRKAVWYLRRKHLHKLRDIADQFDAFEDEPWAHCFKEFDEWYPDAKFILTIRKTPDSWCNSLVNHCDRVRYNEHRCFFFGHIIVRGHENALKAIYNRHNDSVIEYFSNRPDKLLVLCWEDEGSLQKLHRFLGVAEDAGNLPRINYQPKKKFPRLSVWRVIKFLPYYYLDVYREYQKERRAKQHEVD